MKFELELIIAVVLIASVAKAQASPVEIWKCKDWRKSASWSKTLVTASIDAGRKKGKITVSGITHTANYRVSGFNRRWDFGLQEDGFQYSFIIKPNGNAAYYDFSGKNEAKPSNIFKCRKKYKRGHKEEV